MKNIYTSKHEFLADYSKSKNRILFLDYDGTLVPFQSRPEYASPSATTLDLLSNLAKDPSNKLVIISGRDKSTLEHWLGDLPATLVAEHGGFFKSPSNEWESYYSNIPEWKTRVYSALHALVFQFEGSFIEEKHFSIAWHYRNILHQINESEKKQILKTIRSIPTNKEFDIYDEDCTLELRSVGIDKGRFAAQYMWDRPDHDFILAMGDGKTDEDLFEAVGKNNYSIKIGNSNNSAARFYLEKQEDVMPLLREISSQGVTP